MYREKAMSIDLIAAIFLLLYESILGPVYHNYILHVCDDLWPFSSPFHVKSLNSLATVWHPMLSRVSSKLQSGNRWKFKLQKILKQYSWCTLADNCNKLQWRIYREDRRLHPLKKSFLQFWGIQTRPSLWAEQLQTWFATPPPPEYFLQVRPWVNFT